jgi:hypothetical protein
MNDLQAKFAMSLVILTAFLAYAIPSMKQAVQAHDSVHIMVGTFYVAPDPNDPNAPHGNVTADEIQTYHDQKAAADRRSMGLQ